MTTCETDAVQAAAADDAAAAVSEPGVHCHRDNLRCVLGNCQITKT